MEGKVGSGMTRWRAHGRKAGVDAVRPGVSTGSQSREDQVLP